MTKKRPTPAPSDIALGTEVIYSITISGLDKVGVKLIAPLLNQHGIPDNQQLVTPATDDAPGQIAVPRLFTRWRGDAEEEAWTEALRADVKRMEPESTIAVGVASRTPLPGYPKGQ